MRLYNTQGVIYMGFMNFGKNEKKNQMDDLDIPPPPPLDNLGMPPPPPAMGGQQVAKSRMDEDLFPPLPPMNQGMGGDIPKPDFGMPPAPASEPTLDFSMESFQPQPTTPMFEKKEEPKKKEEKSYEEDYKPAPQREESRDMFAFHNITADNSVFIEVTKYKKVVKDLNLLKKSLKDTDDKIDTIIGDISEEEKTFSSLHGILKDVEDKLHVLDDSIFGK
jgi:hypothetical protein